MCQHVLIVIDFIIVFCWPQSQWGRTFIIIWDEWMKVVQKLIFKLIEKGIKNTTVWFKTNLLTERWHQNALWWRIAKTHAAVYRLNNNAASMQFYSQLLNTTVTSVTFKHCHLIARAGESLLVTFDLLRQRFSSLYLSTIFYSSWPKDMKPTTQWTHCCKCLSLNSKIKKNHI